MGMIEAFDDLAKHLKDAEKQIEDLEKELAKEKEVIITVCGGVVDVRPLPKGVKVKIVDYDVEWTDGNRVEKFEGNDVVISEIEASE